MVPDGRFKRKSGELVKTLRKNLLNFIHVDDGTSAPHGKADIIFWIETLLPCSYASAFWNRVGQIQAGLLFVFGVPMHKVRDEVEKYLERQAQPSWQVKEHLHGSVQHIGVRWYDRDAAMAALSRFVTRNTNPKKRYSLVRITRKGSK